MEISICVGSSCHLKGSHDVIESFKKAVKENKLEEKVTLKATFCLGKCSFPGVTCKFDDKIVTGVSIHNFDEIFKTEVLEVLK